MSQIEFKYVKPTSNEIDHKNRQKIYASDIHPIELQNGNLNKKYKFCKGLAPADQVESDSELKTTDKIEDEEEGKTEAVLPRVSNFFIFYVDRSKDLVVN